MNIILDNWSVLVYYESVILCLSLQHVFIAMPSCSCVNDVRTDETG
jgi:hypothetical protein